MSTRREFQRPQHQGPRTDMDTNYDRNLSFLYSNRPPPSAAPPSCPADQNPVDQNLVDHQALPGSSEDARPGNMATPTQNRGKRHKMATQNWRTRQRSPEATANEITTFLNHDANQNKCYIDYGRKAWREANSAVNDTGYTQNQQALEFAKEEERASRAFGTNWIEHVAPPFTWDPSDLPPAMCTATVRSAVTGQTYILGGMDPQQAAFYNPQYQRDARRAFEKFETLPVGSRTTGLGWIRNPDYLSHPERKQRDEARKKSAEKRRRSTGKGKGRKSAESQQSARSERSNRSKGSGRFQRNDAGNSQQQKDKPNNEAGSRPTRRRRRRSPRQNPGGEASNQRLNGEASNQHLNGVANNQLLEEEASNMHLNGEASNQHLVIEDGDQRFNHEPSNQPLNSLVLETQHPDRPFEGQVSEMEIEEEDGGVKLPKEGSLPTRHLGSCFPVPSELTTLMWEQIPNHCH